MRNQQHLKKIFSIGKKMETKLDIFDDNGNLEQEHSD